MAPEKPGGQVGIGVDGFDEGEGRNDLAVNENTPPVYRLILLVFH